MPAEGLRRAVSKVGGQFKKKDTLCVSFFLASGGMKMPGASKAAPAQILRRRAAANFMAHHRYGPEGPYISKVDAQL